MRVGASATPAGALASSFAAQQALGRKWRDLYKTAPSAACNARPGSFCSSGGVAAAGAAAAEAEAEAEAVLTIQTSPMTYSSLEPPHLPPGVRLIELPRDQQGWCVGARESKPRVLRTRAGGWLHRFTVGFWGLPSPGLAATLLPCHTLHTRTYTTTQNSAHTST